MTDPLRSRDIDILGEASVYPGHPTVLAYLILLAYADNINEAFARGRQYPNALEDVRRIPGAGGNVYAALDVIRYVRDGTLSVEEAIEWADKQWAACDSQRDGWRTDAPDVTAVRRARWQAGQNQADRFRERVVEELRRLMPSPPSPSTRPV